jgi:hypothetical protein
LLGGEKAEEQSVEEGKVVTRATAQIERRGGRRRKAGFLVLLGNPERLLFIGGVEGEGCHCCGIL